MILKDIDRLAGRGGVSELDDWLRAQCDKLAAPMHDYIMQRGDLNDPQYRQQLGQHQAYMRVRSYLSGTRKRADHPPRTLPMVNLTPAVEPGPQSERLTDDEIGQALIAIVTAIERGGCPVGMCYVRDSDEGGMTIIAHYSNERARVAIRAIEIGDGADSGEVNDVSTGEQ